jgi:hypothetical protein
MIKIDSEVDFEKEMEQLRFETPCAGRDEIWVGVYDNKDEEIAAFFHELGHCIDIW